MNEEHIIRSVIGCLLPGKEHQSLTELRNNIGKQVSRDVLKQLILKYHQYFETFKDGQTFVRYATKLSLCEDHSSKHNKCKGIPFCTGLHICKYYVLSGTCKFKQQCLFGHDLTTEHNMKILKQQFLDGVSAARIKEVLKNDQNRDAVTKPKVCKFYNLQAGCRREESGQACPHLHICKHYIGDSCRFGPKCKRSHNIMAPDIKKILEEHAISTRRTPKEIKADLKTILADGRDSNSLHSDPSTEGRPGRLRGLQRATSDMALASAGTVCTREEQQAVTPTGVSRRAQSASRKPAVLTPFTAMSMGGVNTDGQPPRLSTPVRPAGTGARPKTRRTPQGPRDGASTPQQVGETFDRTSRMLVCMYHLKGRCAYGERCFNYHSQLSYQWQYQMAGATDWTEVQPDENTNIELHYSDPQHADYVLMIGSMLVKLQFKTMRGSDGLSHLTFRRLSTESSVVMDTQPLATNWVWYWQTQMGDWKRYGDADGGYKADISIQEIEQAYVASPDGQMSFVTQGHQYVLDFPKMTQRNLEYKTERDVARRPEFVAKEKLELLKRQPARAMRGALQGGVGIDAVRPPKHWSIGATDQLLTHYKIVKLNERNPQTAREYRKIEAIFSESLVSTVSIQSIERVENGELWHNYYTKKLKMRRKNGDRDVDERRLFHGTQSQYEEAISSQGFDFRLSGTSSGTAYGKGSYFSLTSKYSNSYTEGSGSKLRIMFIAKVLVGEYTLGKRELTRPPFKTPGDLTSPLYDSCVNNTSDPQIFVIFENAQVYPEYIVKYDYNFNP